MRKLIALSVGIMILVVLLPALAATNETLSQLVVDGEGEISVSPDMVTIELGVETTNASSEIAAAQNAEIMNRTMKALFAAGMKSEFIQDSQYSLEIPSEDFLLRAFSKEEIPPEYVASRSITIKMNATEDIGRYIEAAVAAGSNKIGGISFYLSDPGPEESKALAEAISNARTKAEMMALSAGVRLGRLLEISEGYSSSYAVAAAAPADGGGEPIQIKPKMIDVSSSVKLTYEVMPLPPETG